MLREPYNALNSKSILCGEKAISISIAKHAPITICRSVSELGLWTIPEGTALRTTP